MIARRRALAAVLLATGGAVAPSNVLAETALAPAPEAAISGRAHGWILVERLERLDVFVRTSPGASLPEARAVTEFRAPLEHVRAVLSDYERFSEFMPYVETCHTVGFDGGDRLVYQRLHFPGPFADRGFVMRVTERGATSRGAGYRIEWTLAREESEQHASTGLVVPDAYEGSWELRPHAGGSVTRATYRLRMNPGGLLPSPLVDFAAVRLLPEVLLAVRARVEAATDTFP